MVSKGCIFDLIEKFYDLVRHLSHTLLAQNSQCYSFFSLVHSLHHC